MCFITNGLTNYGRRALLSLGKCSAKEVSIKACRSTGQPFISCGLESASTFRDNHFIKTAKMDFGPLDMLQLMHTVYAIPPEPVEPIAPVPFAPGEFRDMWCRNPAGDKVEWSIMYKAPAASMSRGTSESISNGVQYGYIDSATKLDATVRMQLFDDITSTQNNALYNTLDVLFKYPRTFLVEKNLTFLTYNDQPPPELAKSTTNGIAKGVLLFGNSSGAWVSHTLGSFGYFFQEKYVFPDDARREGQTILCMSLSSENWPKIVAHLRRESPNIYDWNISPAMFDMYPALKQLIEKDFNHEDPGAESNVFSGVNGTDFMAFVKNAVHNYDIYETMVAPQLEANMFVRGSQEGDQHLENYCTDFNITEVDKVELKLSQDIIFKNVRRSQDNSRWAVSERDYWVCFGSVERRKSHLPRGGEVFCFQNQPASILMANSIEEFSKCKPLPEEIVAKIAAAPAGTAVDVGNGATYVRPAIVRPLFGVPRVYYGGLPSFGIGFPFKKILKNPLVVGAAVAGVMHYRHKQQIKKLNQQHALAMGYGRHGVQGFSSPYFGGSSGKYSTGLASLFGGGKSHSAYPGAGYTTMGGGGYPTMGGGYSPGPGFAPPTYPGPPSYPPPAYSPTNSGFNTGHHLGYPPRSGGYPTDSHGYPIPGYPIGSHGYPNPSYPTTAGGHSFAPHNPGYPTQPRSSYPSQPAYNPSFNAVNNAPSIASAPPMSTTQNVAKQQSNFSSGTASKSTVRTSRPSTPNRPVRVEKTVTRTVTSYTPSRSASRGSSRKSSGRNRGGSRGRG